MKRAVIRTSTPSIFRRVSGRGLESIDDLLDFLPGEPVAFRTLRRI